MADHPGRVPYAFVLMQFREDFKDVYELGIKGACREVGVRCERVDEQIFQENILSRVYKEIRRADLIISELTGRNPNVFYETGYAHAIGKKVILLTQSESDIPFDLKQYQHIIYGTKIVSLRDRLTLILRSCLDAESQQPPISQALPPPDLSEIHRILRDLQDHISKQSSPSAQATITRAEQDEVNCQLWRTIVEVFNRAKRIYVLAQEYDDSSLEFLQPVLEHRSALDHIIRAKASGLGLLGPDKETTYERKQLEKALGHLYRAFFDAADWFSLSMRERIIELVKPYSHDIIAETIPEYFSEMRPTIERIGFSLAERRSVGDSTLDPVDTISMYDTSLEELSKIYERLVQAVPAMAEKNRRRTMWWKRWQGKT